jgi:ABC-2 type transport system permease protein
MRKSVLILFARQIFTGAFTNKAVLWLLGMITVLIVYAAWSGLTIYQQQTQSRELYQKEVREHWEKMPDKHPHRMAHYGYIAFRAKHPLSFFDFGMESYTGNAVFLEAHRQNTVNFSEAGFSTGMLRFGEISMAMILQLLVPLVIFFIGFNTVATDRENGTLKILLSQGTSWKEIILGKAMGLLGIALSVLLPVIIVLIVSSLLIQKTPGTAEDMLRILWIALSYTLYFAIISIMAVVVSAMSRTAKGALVSLIGIWLLFTVILPRTAQAVGHYLYASPSSIEFATAIEKDLIKKGDSHDPNDPYYKALKDSILKVYKVDSIQQLPFNYSGFQMKEGEKISAAIYNQHLFSLLHTYEKQNNVSRILAFINPFAALRNFSMAMSGTDFHSYTRFQQQAEEYRYRLAQHMNELQIKLISNKKPGDHDKPYSISKAYWKAFPDFEFNNLSEAMVIKHELLSLAALVFWIALLWLLVAILSKKLKAI